MESGAVHALERLFATAVLRDDVDPGGWVPAVNAVADHVIHGREAGREAVTQVLDLALWQLRSVLKRGVDEAGARWRPADVEAVIDLAGRLAGGEV